MYNRKIITSILRVMALIVLSHSALNLYGAKEKKRPNILIAISDDQSFYHTGYQGASFIETPGFDRIAKEGVYFTNCYAGSPGCAPSRSSFVTGRHHWQNEQSGQHASSWLKKHIPFVDILKQDGYNIGRTGKGVGPFRYAKSSDHPEWRKENAAGEGKYDIKYSKDSDIRISTGVSPTNYFANFKKFIDNKDAAPFYFWFGGHEPHRVFEKGSYKRVGKSLDEASVPAFLPDTKEVRADILDYAVEIEWFDSHLVKMIQYLEEVGELENTIIIVTSDNGMSFPRAKANCYEYGVHVPLAIRFPSNLAITSTAQNTVTTPVSFIDIAPTILELAGSKSGDMMPITGESIVDIVSNQSSANEKENQRAVFSGRERHSSSRYMNMGYPQRSIRKGAFLYIWNITPERWPAGAPQVYNPKDTTELRPLYSIDSSGNYTGDGAFADIDECPTKEYIIKSMDSPEYGKFFNLACDKRPEYELYDITKDPECLCNLSNNRDYKQTEEKLREELMSELKRSKDPRVSKDNFNVFDTYKRYSRMRKFPKP